MKKQYLAILFNITFFLGYLFRCMNFGWMMFMLALPEYILRSIYYICGMQLIKKPMSTFKLILISAMQIFYLLTSLFSTDLSDNYSYTFASFWKNPPLDAVLALWIIFASITLLLIIIAIFTIIKERKLPSEHINYFNILVGLQIIPIAAIGSAYLILSGVDLIKSWF